MINTKKIPVMELIKRVADEQKIKPADMARQLGLRYSTAHSMLHRESIQVQRLADLSELFQYNFFRELAREFPFEQPDFSDHSEVEQLQARIRELEIENRTLQETFRQVLGR